MSSYNSSTLSCLAGLDAMVLHFGDEPPFLSPDISSAAIDGIPYVTISKSGKMGPLAPISRSPLSDKSLDLNVISAFELLRPRVSSTVIRREALREAKSNTRRRAQPTSTSFHPLPPVPSASLLQLPSFFLPSPEPTSPNPASPSLSQTHEHPLFNLSQPLFPRRTEEPRLSKINNDLYDIPAFQHPNSPYVPWASPARREFLRPLTPASNAPSSHYSRPYSRSGARAPEPPEHNQRQHEGARVSKTWKAFRRAVTKNVKHVSKSIYNIKKPFKALIEPTSSCKKDVSHTSINLAPAEGTTTTSQATSHRFPSSSVASFESSNTTTLDAWLAARRDYLERDYSPKSMMTLDEYERSGSWIHHLDQDAANTLCGVPGCEIHSPRRSTLSSAAEGQYSEAPSHSLPSISVSHNTLSRSHSFPQLSVQSLWLDSDDKLPTGGSYSYNTPVRNARTPSMSRKREREMSMPGGWTFNS